MRRHRWPGLSIHRENPKTACARRPCTHASGAWLKANNPTTDDLLSNDIKMTTDQPAGRGTFGTEEETTSATADDSPSRCPNIHANEAFAAARGAPAERKAYTGGAAPLPTGGHASDVFSKRIVANDQGEARRLLQEAFPGVSVLPGPAGDLAIDLKTDYLDGMVTHQLSTTTGVKLRFPEQYDGYLLAALDEGGLALEMGQKWKERPAPGAVMVDARRVSRWRWQPGHYELLLVDAARLHNRLAGLLERPVVQPVQFQFDVPPQAPGIRFAREIARVARMCTTCETHGLQCAREALRNLQDALMYTMLETIPHNYSVYLARRNLGPSPRHVRRAMDYIRANAASEIALEDIAKAAHISIRALQTGFSKFKGLTPMAYLKQIRLEGAHAELCRPDGEKPIAEIARRWRFHHLGQFARDYRKAFGQAPSETRRAARLAER